MTAAAQSYDFERTKQAALSVADTVLAWCLPGGKYQGKEYQSLNSTRSDSKPGSFDKVKQQDERYTACCPTHDDGTGQQWEVDDEITFSL